METIYLIRHEKTVANHEGRFCGQSETSLWMDAEKNLKSLAEFFKEISLDFVFSSPMRRAQKTAEALERPLIIKDGFIEIDFGIFEGHTFQEIQQLYPEEAEKILGISSFNEYYTYRYPGGEDLATFYNRCVDSFLKICDSLKPGASIAIVAHSGTIKAILSFALIGKPDLFWKMKIDNGSISKVDRVENFYTVDYINRIP